jgi:hypothetical protein
MAKMSQQQFQHMLDDTRQAVRYILDKTERVINKAKEDALGDLRNLVRKFYGQPPNVPPHRRPDESLSEAYKREIVSWLERDSVDFDPRALIEDFLNGIN